ncbi:hypothetical protein CTI12_AA466560 [Artemisia annua]|uniref:Uncharacterized protein n=1 Tax=Artemisia annua TaxID=35608 RepID=A0A2U1LLG7_ARTAN|nr:hypothetical protein CTI12_AA466560 [Artemisia annua]
MNIFDCKGYLILILYTGSVITSKGTVTTKSKQEGNDCERCIWGSNVKYSNKCIRKNKLGQFCSTRVSKSVFHNSTKDGHVRMVDVLPELVKDVTGGRKFKLNSGRKSWDPTKNSTFAG